MLSLECALAVWYLGASSTNRKRNRVICLVGLRRWSWGQNYKKKNGGNREHSVVLRSWFMVVYANDLNEARNKPFVNFEEKSPFAIVLAKESTADSDFET